MTTPVLGILGGMGPLATSVLFQRIVTLTRADSDQDHLRILVDNNPAIPDRTAYILGHGENPRPELCKTARHLVEMGAEILLMPCNTAHHFHHDIQEQIHVPLLHMVRETARHVAVTFPEHNRIGLLATDGTLEAGIYHTAFTELGRSVVAPEGDDQKAVMDLIYGIKAGQRPPITGFMEAMKRLRAGGVGIFILGCTELSVAQSLYGLEGAFVDPLSVVASVAIRKAGKKVNAPH